MVDSSLILSTGLMLLIVIVYIIIRKGNQGKKKVDLNRLYKKSKFMETNIQKNSEKDTEDKLKILEYESQTEFKGQNDINFNTKELNNQKKIGTERETEKTVNSSLESIYSFNDIRVESINGIGSSYATRLKHSGISTISDLLKATTTSAGLEKLQDETGIYIKLLINWRKQADLLRISGLSKNHIEKLSEMEIESTNQLAFINPENLHEKMLSKYAYSETPSIGIIKRWVRIAKQLQQIDSIQ